MALVPTWFFVVSAALLGGILGSFVNAAVHRLPRNISMLTRSRSFCPKCDKTIAWHDNLPILSFLILGGKCRACRNPIPARYLIVELLVAGLFAVSAWQYFGLNRPAPGAANPMPLVLMVVQMLLVADLVCAAFSDLETYYIPFQTTVPWILVGLILAPLCPELHLSATPWTGSPRWDALFDSVQGLILGAGTPWLVGFVCIVILGKPGMGGGDAYLLGMFGAMLGWKPALEVLILGIFFGTFIGIALLVWDKWQMRRLGPKWKPRRPAFEIDEEEEQLGPEPDWPLLAFGAFVMLFECGLAYAHDRNQQAFEHQATLISAVLGAIVGFNLLVAYPVKKRMLATGRWPQGEIRQREDGKKEEILEGNYMPFGPSLVLAALCVLFYDPLFREVVYWWFAGRISPTGAPVTLAAYLAANPLPFEVPWP
ncbi:MAG: prepilin peptidase [Planctomycetota bacterium]|nr:prepilin peptidase [Planctomycetota bacterium]